MPHSPICLFSACLCLLGCSPSEPSSGFNPVETPFEPDVEWAISANPHNVFSALAEVTVDQDVTVSVEYDADNERTQRTPDHGVSEGEITEVLVLGLKAETTYDLWVVVAPDDGRTWTSKREEYTTGPLPYAWDECVVTTEDPVDFDPNGVICTGTGEHTDPFHFFCVERSGDPVWAMAQTDFDAMMALHPLVEGGFAASGCYDNIKFFDEYGEMTGSFTGDTLGERDTRFEHHEIDHHEVIEIRQGRWAGAVAFATGTTVYITDEDHPEPVDHTAAGIVVYDRDSDTVLWDWNAHGEIGDGVPIDPLLSYSRHGLLNEQGDWNHPNALVHEVGDDGNEYFWLSLRTQDWVIKIDVDTDGIVWRLGYEGDFELVDDLDDPSPLDPRLWAYHQHSHQILDVGPDGRKSILIYDNGSVRPNEDGQPDDAPRYSRVVEFEIDEETMRATPVFAHGNPEGEGDHYWWTGYYGGASMLPDKEAVVYNHGEQSILVDVEYPSGDERWRYECPNGDFYRVDYFPSIYDMGWRYPQDR